MVTTAQTELSQEQLDRFAGGTFIVYREQGRFPIMAGKVDSIRMRPNEITIHPSVYQEGVLDGALTEKPKRDVSFLLANIRGLKPLRKEGLRIQYEMRGTLTVDLVMKSPQTTWSTDR